jgi:hypothetical protein
MNADARETPRGNIALKIVIVDKVDVVEAGRWSDCGWSSPGWRGSWRKSRRVQTCSVYGRVRVCLCIRSRALCMCGNGDGGDEQEFWLDDQIQETRFRYQLIRFAAS